MAIDLTAPLFILAKIEGDRLAIFGGSNNEREVRLAAALSPSFTLLRAEVIENNGMSDAAA